MAKILLVDDQPHIIRLLKLNLEKSGYVLETAKNGIEALSRLAESSFDVMITDIEMPKMGGKELCERIYGDSKSQKPYIYVVTAKADRELRDWVNGFPDMEFIEKPVSFRNLQDRLLTHFEQIKDAG